MPLARVTNDRSHIEGEAARLDVRLRLVEPHRLPSAKLFERMTKTKHRGLLRDERRGRRNRKVDNEGPVEVGSAQVDATDDERLLRRCGSPDQAREAMRDHCNTAH